MEATHRILAAPCQHCNAFFDIAPSLTERAYGDPSLHAQRADCRAEQVEALSPISRMSALVDPSFVARAEDEPPLLHASNDQFSSAVRERGLLVESYVAPGRNHFNMVLDLMGPRSALFRKMAGIIVAGGGAQ